MRLPKVWSKVTGVYFFVTKSDLELTVVLPQFPESTHVCHSRRVRHGTFLMPQVSHLQSHLCPVLTTALMSHTLYYPKSYNNSCSCSRLENQTLARLTSRQWIAKPNPNQCRTMAFSELCPGVEHAKVVGTRISETVLCPYSEYTLM